MRLTQIMLVSQRYYLFHIPRNHSSWQSYKESFAVIVSGINKQTVSNYMLN